jgi:hypothetical protein
MLRHFRLTEDRCGASAHTVAETYYGCSMTVEMFVVPDKRDRRRLYSLNRLIPLDVPTTHLEYIYMLI